jgi:hypothetical protein
MKITGAHTILYSKDAEAGRVFLPDVLGFPHVGRTFTKPARAAMLAKTRKTGNAP